jgi:hypothetical protein
MKQLPLLSLLFFAACPATNPRQLWIGPGGSEAELELVDREPDPF